MMKLLIGAAVLGSLSFNTGFAENLGEICDVSARISEKVMRGRQSGDLMEEYMKIGNSADNAILKKMMGRIVIMAYDSPLYSNEADKKNAIIEFRNTIYRECQKVMMDN